jgi:broad specificity phosphatase PhoE
MSEQAAPELWLVRHGETEWSRDGLHTSVTDLPLTERGVEVARLLAGRLDGTEFDLVLTSPRLRARRTAELAGHAQAEVDEDLAEWAYGDYEGVSTAEIRRTVAGWTVWSHPSPGGESADDVTTRLGRVVERVRQVPGRTLVFGHGHALHTLTAL